MSILRDVFAGRPPSLGHVDPNARAELLTALAAYRDAEALTDHFNDNPADLTAAQRARVALVALSTARDPEAQVFKELIAAERRLAAAICRMGRRLPASVFREGGDPMPCKGVVHEGRLFLAIDDPSEHFDFAVITLAGIFAVEGGAL